MKSINLRRVFLVSGFTILILVYAVLYTRMITSQTQRTGSDFIASFAVARVSQQWGTTHAYDLNLQQKVEAQVVGFELAPGQVLMFNHSPFLVPLLMLLVNGSYVGSLLRYTALLVALYLACAAILAWLLRSQNWDRNSLLLALVGVCTFYPLIVSLINAQETAFLVLGGFLLLAGSLAGRNWLAGIGLALTAVRPHVTLLLALPFLFKQRKVFGWFCLAALVLGSVSLAVIGFAGIKPYLLTLFASTNGTWYGLHESAMVNLIGLLWRIGPNLNAGLVHGIGWGFYGLTLLGLCILWARSQAITEKQILLATTLAVFAAPHLHYHDLALLLVAIISAILLLVRSSHLKTDAAGPVMLGISLILLFSSSLDALLYNLPYLLMLLLLLIPWLIGRNFLIKQVPEASHESL